MIYQRLKALEEQGTPVNVGLIATGTFGTQIVMQDLPDGGDPNRRCLRIWIRTRPDPRTRAAASPLSVSSTRKHPTISTVPSPTAIPASRAIPRH